MTQSKNASLIQLAEVFPTWPQEDLITVLNEAGGDVYVAISRISEGHVSQWSDSSKKAAASMTTFESRPMRTDRNRESRNNSNFSSSTRTERDRNQRPVVREQRERPQYTENRKSNNAPTKASAPIPSKPAAISKNSQVELSWGDDSAKDFISAPVSMVSAAAVAEPKTSFAEAAASALAEKPKKKKKEVHAPVVDVIVKAEPEVIEKTQFVEAAPVESVPVPVAVEIDTALVSEEFEPEVEVVPAVVHEESEDEEIVSMPARATPSLTMEQPAVVLPVRTNLRTNLSVRFGYDSSVEEIEKSTSVAIEETIVQNVKTPITVSALESTFAMLSTSPVPAVKSPEPILSPPSPEASAWENSRNSSGAPSSGYGNFSRNRQHGGWDYETTSSASTGAPAASQGGSFGPAPGFSGPTSPAAPQRFVSRAAAQYEHPGVYSPSAVPSTGGANSNNSRFSPYDESNTGSNNVSQYYTNRTGPQSTSGYPVYRGNNSFNASRYSTSNRPYYQQHPHHQPAPAAQQQSASAGHYSPYNPHQNYLNNYHHGYPQYHQHSDQYSNQQQQQPQQAQQPYYQPYQPPTQYLSNSNMHHHNHHHQNQHHNA